MASQDSTMTRVPKPEPDLDFVGLAKMTRKTIERLAPFCQMRFPPDTPNQTSLVPKTNSKILRLIQAVDTSMLVAQIGYRLSSDATTMCDPFAPALPTSTSSVNVYGHGGKGITQTPEMLQTMAAHGHGHCLKVVEAFRDIQQEIYRIAASTKDNETTVLVPPDPQQPATRPIKLKDAGTNLVDNLPLLERFSRFINSLTAWWEWLEEEFMSPESQLLPSLEFEKRDAVLSARWGKVKGGYLDYYNTIRVVYARYPQLFTTSSTAWQSISTVPRVPSAPGSSWDGSYEDLGNALPPDPTVIQEENGKPTNSSRDLLRLRKSKSSILSSKPQKEKSLKEETKAKGRNRVRLVALATRFGLGKVFERKKRSKGKEEADPTTEKETAVIDVNVNPPAPPPTSTPKPAAPTSTYTPAAEKTDNRTIHVSTPMVIVVQGSAPAAGVPTNGVTDKTEEAERDVVQEEKPTSAEKEKVEETEKKGLFTNLKNLFAKLGCHTGEGMEA